ncbi:hypothetical protein ACEWY4_020863 [Coilia grayii]|uniref:C2H2-type domain-containing protein n=1 Tax=Coilia grayii TaxID=363190 RepID=A0ABD1J7C1_9TELE
MFPCQICSHNCATIVSYVRHMKIHKNTPNLTFKCVLPDCSKTFRNFSTFKCHTYRHRVSRHVVSPTLHGVELSCHVDFCSARCETLTTFYSHLKTHIREGKTVVCPYRHCSKSFTVLSTFTSHMSRAHKNVAEKNLSESIVNPGVSNEGKQDGSDMQIDHPSDSGDELDIYPETANESQFFKNVALFYLKLQAKFLLPSSLIQTIIEDFQEIHDISQSHLLFKLKEKLMTLGISEADTNNVIEVIKTEDLFRTCNTQPLKTDQKRKTVFKNSFNHVEPVQICLGQNEAGKECFAQYVPIKQTIASLFCCESVQEQYKQMHSSSGSKDVLKDVWDGKNMAENELFHTEGSSLGLILYQDAFEVVNPLGSGRKKHKILAMYLTLADLMPHNRSSTDQMQLVLLCKEHDFKYFGQDLVMGTLVNDLKELEVNGVTLSDGKVYKGTVCAIAGDNLGSHNIGGFVENFSRSSHFCRYCDISREAFHADPLIQATKRTVQSYNSHVQSSEGQSTSSGGVKFDSLFNTLKYFHVCQPGLPPCIGHDLFEGIVSSDLALYIFHLVKVDKVFSYLELNRRINQFKYLGRDANNKPCEVNPEGGKLGGHAVQNWCLLRMLPALIGDKIKNPGDNKVWQLVLQLREVVDLICAPAISNGQIAYLRVLIDEYLHYRVQTFPDNPLKPKHHYVSHYPELIIQFGPLIRLWTLRFESKHTYFKHEEIKEIICKTLPNLSQETQLQIISKLQSSGLESKEDLKYVQQEDIADLLPVIQCRKLLDAFKLVIPTSSSLSSSECSLPGSPSPCTLPNSSSSPNSSSIPTCSNRPSTSTPIKKTWPETFQVPWEQMPAAIRTAIANGTRPTPPERRQMVRVLADAMTKYEENPTRAQCLTVVRNIIRQYPKTFADLTSHGSLLCGGYTTLLIQVKNRIENINRDRSFSRHRSSTGKRGPTDTYGCTRFHPEIPPEETCETLEQQRQKLEGIYRQDGAGGAERAEVKHLMELTFSLQRRHINILPPPDIEDLKSKWPFLFLPKYIYAHFQLLTDINVLRSLELGMEECGRTIIEYFREKPTNKEVKRILSNGVDNDLTLRVLQLLMAHFGEDSTGLILLTDVSATAADVETTLSYPASPRLILPEQVAIGGWMITLEGHVISESITPTFATGLAAVFAIYYIFNLQYQHEAACTLEFIQR